MSASDTITLTAKCPRCGKPEKLDDILADMREISKALYNARLAGLNDSDSFPYECVWFWAGYLRGLADRIERAARPQGRRNRGRK